MRPRNFQNFPAVAVAAIALALVSPGWSQDDAPPVEIPGEVQEQPTPTDSAAEEPENSDRSSEQTMEQQLKELVTWESSDAGKIGDLATIEIPQGYRYTGAQGAETLLSAMGNLTNGQNLGFIAPDSLEWFGIFEFNAIGYVKDDDKDKLDPDELLESLKKGQEQANLRLTEMGQAPLEILGWKMEPEYNERTKNLEWAIRLSSNGGPEFINHNTKILGREGVMDVVLVCDAEQLDSALADYRNLLTGFEYIPSKSYAAYEEGDPVAKYGLAGLIAGGGLLVAAKTGLLAKFFKPIAIGALALLAVAKRFFTGRSKTEI